MAQKAAKEEENKEGVERDQREEAERERESNVIEREIRERARDYRRERAESITHREDG